MGSPQALARLNIMAPLDLFKAGKLDEAIAALSEELRRDPTDTKRRTFLFELLCFAGNYERAGKQLEILGQGHPNAEMGAAFYRGLLQATLTRQDVYLNRKNAPINGASTAAAKGGLLNGAPFETLEDADSRIGANLEVYAAGTYLLIPFALLQSVECESPRRLRDLLWIPAVLRTSPAYQERDLGETLLPALTPFAAANPSDSVRLGRETVWETIEGGDTVPVGQKIFLMNGEEIPILELRKVEFLAALPAP